MQLDLVEELRLSLHHYVAGEGTRRFERRPHVVAAPTGDQHQQRVVGLHYHRHR